MAEEIFASIIHGRPGRQHGLERPGPAGRRERLVGQPEPGREQRQLVHRSEAAGRRERLVGQPERGREQRQLVRPAAGPGLLEHGARRGRQPELPRSVSTLRRSLEEWAAGPTRGAAPSCRSGGAGGAVRASGAPRASRRRSRSGCGRPSRAAPAGVRAGSSAAPAPVPNRFAVHTSR